MNKLYITTYFDEYIIQLNNVDKPDLIAKQLNINTLKYINILKKCGAYKKKQRYWKKYICRYEWYNIYIFTNINDAENALEILETIFMINKIRGELK